MRDKVEQTTWIPGARFSMKDLGIRAEPYLMARDSPVNQAAMTVRPQPCSPVQAAAGALAV